MWGQMIYARFFVDSFLQDRYNMYKYKELA